MLCVNKKCTAELLDGAKYCHMCGRDQNTTRRRVKRANGQGTVYKLTDHRRRRPWVAARNGIMLGYYKTRGEAIEILDSTAKMDVGEYFNMTFEQIYSAWKLEHFRNIGDKGKEGYELSYKRLTSLHKKRFRDIRTSDYQEIIDNLIKEGLSHSTTNKVKQLAGQMSKWGMREDIITTNYAQFIILQENITKEKKVFADADIKKLEASKDDAAKIVLMLIDTGMRIGELFQLPTADVFDTYCIGGSKTKNGKNRIIPIPSTARKYFKYFKGKADPDGILLSGYEGDRTVTNFRNRAYYPLLEALGIEKKSPHSTRHTYASRAVEAGMQPEMLQKILGHADYSTTSNIYVHADVDALVKAAESLARKEGKKKRNNA